MAELRLTKHAVVYSLLFVLIIGLALYSFYSTNTLKNQISAMSVKLEQAENDYNQKIQSLQSSVGEEILALGSTVKTIDTKAESIKQEVKETKNKTEQQFDFLQTMVVNQQKQSQEKIESLQDLIEDVEKQNNIELSELKTQLENIDVSSDFTAIVDDVINSVVSVIAGSTQGSGAVISANGYIVTNYHVVQGASSIKVLTYSGQLHDAAFIGAETTTDLAVLKVNANLPKLDFADSDSVKVGEKVIALGNPGGFDFSVTEGIISAVHRTGPNGLSIYLQTDVPVNPGNSGGPLVNKNGKIVGINNFKITGFESLAFAIESNTVKQVTEHIINQT